MIVVLDFETALTDGTPSVQFYRPDFRAISCSFAWRDTQGNLRTRYVTGEKAIRADLERLQKLGVTLVAHNVQFDLAVAMYRFKGLDFKWVDTMRLLQVGDNGRGTPEGFSLQAGVARWLPFAYHNHKEPYYEKIREQGVKRGKEGANLHLLSPEDLCAYNVKDAEVTLLLYERLTEYFKEIDYDWTIDHELFIASLPFYINAEGRGVLVDRDQAKQAVDLFHSEILRIERDFTERFRDQIAAVEQRLRESKLASYKTERGRSNAALDDCKFKLNSTKHLKMLFIDELKLTPRFKTEKGNPTFGAKLLWQYGEPGQMLDKKGRMKIQQDQAKALVENSADDSRWHLRIKAVGTKTDRGAGGSHAST